MACKAVHTSLHVISCNGYFCFIHDILTSIVEVSSASYLNHKMHKASSKYEYHVSNKIMKYHTPVKLVQ